MKQKHSVLIEELGITLNTGSIARQASGAVTIQLGETVLFVSATAAKSLRPDQDFFPLTVDYRDKFAAAGRFPGGFFKREGRPSEKEITTSRLCDRPLRPLFPKDYINEVQIIGLLMSTDLQNEPDTLMVNGASAALMVSDIPFNNPIGCVRIAEINGEFVVNPTNDAIYESRLDLIYVGTEDNMMMIEGSADQLSEERFQEALEFAHNAIKPIIRAQHELAEKCGVQKKTEYEGVTLNEQVLEIARRVSADTLEEALYVPGKQDRDAKITAVKEAITNAVEAELTEEGAYGSHDIRNVFEKLQEEIIRRNILDNGKRLDGRGEEELRQLEMDVDVLPRVHGSSLFQRGETQSVVLATLGTSKDAQELDGLTGGPESKSFLLHYNFPPYSVGETGRFIGAGRREIGHGALAERSLLSVIPAEEDFPYSIRLVSEIMESNGSTSMASICGGTLALLDAGVPILAPVAGISCGLVTEYEGDKIARHKVITDILGSEDHFGDMDFKVAGTRDGITGFQVDLKIPGLPLEIAKEAVIRNRETRLFILDEMEKVMPSHRAELKSQTPRIENLQIDPDKIGALIGPGGKNIKRIVEVTGAQIDIKEDNSGNVSVFSNDGEAMKRAIYEIQASVAEIEEGKTYNAVVKEIREFGAIVECLPGKDGLVHISELSDERVEKPEDVCAVGDAMQVKCVGLDEKGRCRLSRKAVIMESQGLEYTPPRPRGGGRNDRGRGGRGGRNDRGDRGRGGDRNDRGDRNRSDRRDRQPAEA